MFVHNDAGTFAGKTYSDTKTVNLPIINVRISGSIHKPGVYSLPFGSNLGDAVEAAGGLAPNGDGGAIPYRVRIISVGQQDHNRFIQIKGNSQWQDEPLRDGDILHFPVVIY